MSAVKRVTVVGGGIIGSSVAYFLTNLGKKGLQQSACNVTVVEKDPHYKFCSTTLSAASIRHQFSNRENVLISKFGTEFLRNSAQHLAVEGGEKVDVQFKEGGYLFLASERGVETLKQNHSVQKKEDADVILLDSSELKSKFPWINTTDIKSASFGVTGEGWFDPWSLLIGFKKKAISQGVTYVQGEVSGFGTDTNQVRSVKLSNGETLVSDVVVNAAGPSAGYVAGLIGISLPVVHKKRCIFRVNCHQRELISHCPLTIDITGVYWRPEGNGFIMGVSPPEDQDPDVDPRDFEVTHSLFEDIIWPTVAERVPAFEGLKVVGSWAGHYDYNTFDHNAILGPHPFFKNFYFANGFSGHGLQQSMAVGRAIAEHILEGNYTSLDLSCFAYERIPENRPVRELNIV